MTANVYFWQWSSKVQESVEKERKKKEVRKEERRGRGQDGFNITEPTIPFMKYSSLVLQEIDKKFWVIYNLKRNGNTEACTPTVPKRKHGQRRR